MKRPPVLFWVAAVIVLIPLSILLSGAVEDGIIRPIVKVFWILKGYFGSIHETILWGFTLIGVVCIAALSLRGRNLHERSHRKKIDKIAGEVSQLAFWIRRKDHGPYPRWYLARKLGHISQEILRGRGGNIEASGKLSGPGWEPPGEIQSYLETALRSTPATFSRQLEANHVSTDPEVGSIVEYLEQFLENNNE
jgi:hypothetical protein